ncbi:very long-chain specific acyl-CoA dehydrogenase, mitochondrial-like [Styela clava]
MFRSVKLITSMPARQLLFSEAPRISQCYIRLQSSSTSASRTQSTATAAVDTAEIAKENVKGEKSNATTAPTSKSFVMNIFKGELVTEQILPFPKTLTEEQEEFVKAMIDPVTKFMNEVNNPAANDTLEKVEDGTFEGLKELGAFGLQVPAELGGVGLSNTQYARVVEIVGGQDMGVGIALGAHQSIGFKGILLRGTQQQKEKYLPTLASGEKLAAFCLTEPASGSDAASIQTRAVKSDCGKYYIMNGSKIWISNGGVADVFTVFAQTAVKQNDGSTKDKISAFIVERDFGGVTSGPPEKKMGIKASNTAEVYFEDVKIPVECMLGKEGDGFKIAMHILNNGRFGMCAGLSGTMQTMIYRAAEHASNRTQFGSKIHEYGTIQEKLARMQMMQYVTECMAYVVCANMDAGYEDFQLEAAIAKIFASESAWTVIDECLQIMGGMGYMKDAGIERFMRDIRIFRIFEGTNEILRLFVALTGIQYAAKAMEPVTKAMKSPITNMGTLFGFGTKYVTKRTKRALGIGGGLQIPSDIHADVSNSAALLTKAIFKFSLASEDLMLKYGKKLVDEQFLLNRVGNSAIDIFSMMAVISRSSKALSDGTDGANNEARMCNIWCAEAAKRIEDNLDIVGSKAAKQQFADMSAIATEIIDKQGIIQKHPLGF